MINIIIVIIIIITIIIVIIIVIIISSPIIVVIIIIIGSFMLHLLVGYLRDELPTRPSQTPTIYHS